MQSVDSCLLCNSDKHTVLFQQRDLFHNGNDIFSIRECSQCGLVFLSPRPDMNELMQFYPESYVAYTVPTTEKQLFKKADRSYGLRKRLKFVEKFVSGGRILDVGCATGAFLQQIQASTNAKWELFGVEPNEYAANIARKVSGCNIYVGMLEAAEYPDNFFDVVTMWDVLEHVYNPVTTLIEIVRILKPNGVVIFSIPNLNSWDAGLFGKYWVGYDAPRHMHTFGDKTLKLLLNRVKLTEVGRACVAGSYFYFVSSILFYLRARYPHNLVTQFVNRYHAVIIVRLLVAPYFWLSDRMIKSTTITVACKPSPPAFND